MVEKGSLAVRELAQRASATGRSQSHLLLTCIAIDALPQMSLEFTPGDWTRASAFLGLLTLYLQLLVTIRTTASVMGRPSGYEPSRWAEGRYPGAFLLSLLTVLGILAGLALLIVPGMLLLALWSLALPALVAERLSTTDAMRRSWRLVRPRFGRLLAINLLWSIPYLAIAAAIIGAIYLTNGASPVVLALSDLLRSALLITGALFWAVVYSAACEAESLAARSVRAPSGGRESSG